MHVLLVRSRVDRNRVAGESRARTVRREACADGTMNRSIQSAVLILAVVSTSVWAQGKTDMNLMQRYGGVLAPDCSNYMLPQLKYLGDSLVVQDGGKAVLTGRNVKAAPTYFGATPPPEFETALTSEVAGGEALVFVFYRSASGLFAAVEGGPKVMAALPAAFKGKRARHCDPNRNAAPGAAAAAAPAAGAAGSGRR